MESISRINLLPSPQASTSFAGFSTGNIGARKRKTIPPNLLAALPTSQKMPNPTDAVAWAPQRECSEVYGFFLIKQSGSQKTKALQRNQIKKNTNTATPSIPSR